MRGSGLVAAALLLLSLGLLRSHSEVPLQHWQPDYASALERSRQQGQPLLAYLYTDWCGYCVQMERTTFRDPRFRRTLGREQIWVKLNAERDPEGIRLRDEAGIDAYPAILILDGDEREAGRLQGYLSASELSTRLEEAMAAARELRQLRAAAGDRPDSPGTHYALAEALLERGQIDGALASFERVIALDPDNLTGLADQARFQGIQALAASEREDEALQQIRDLEARFPASPLRAEAALLQAKILYYRGEAARARTTVQGFLQDFPDHDFRYGAEQLLAEIEADLRP